MSAQAALKPIDLGANVAEVEMAAEALARAAMIYRIYPNYELCQETKAAYFRQYQAAVATLMGALVNG